MNDISEGKEGVPIAFQLESSNKLPQIFTVSVFEV